MKLNKEQLELLVQRLMPIEYLNLSELSIGEESKNEMKDWVSFSIEGKRPFGNSYIKGDICEILGIEDDEEENEEKEQIFIQDIFNQLANYMNVKLGIFADEKEIGNIYISNDGLEKIQVVGVNKKDYLFNIIEGRNKSDKAIPINIVAFNSVSFNSKFIKIDKNN